MLAVLGDLLAIILNTSMATFKIAGPKVIVEKTILETISNLANIMKVEEHQQEDQ